MLRSGIIRGVLALAMTTAIRAEQPFRDEFIDGSKRTAPLLVGIGALQTTIGASPDEPGYMPQQIRRRVQLSSYAIGATEVTNAEFCEFLNEQRNARVAGLPPLRLEDESAIRKNGDRFEPRPGFEKRPVVLVTWHGARAYCRWLTTKTGRIYDLPTSAQWEVAARAGTTTAWIWGNSDDPSRHRTRSPDGPRSVASYPPNAWGLYDTTGNVWEWVLDCWAGDAAAITPSRDPVLLNERCVTPEIRGGGYEDGEDMTRPGYRTNYWWSTTVDSIGFRVAAVWTKGARQ